MASNRPLASRRAQRVKVSDENATAHGPAVAKRAIPTFGGAQRIPIANKAESVAAAPHRAALGEITINHRKDFNIPGGKLPAGTSKRSRSSSLAAAVVVPQRIPPPPLQASSAANRPAVRGTRISVPSGRTNPPRVDNALTVPNLKGMDEDDMEIETDIPDRLIPFQHDVGSVETGEEEEELHKTEVEAMVGVESAPLLSLRPRSPAPSSPTISSPAVPLPTSPSPSSKTSEVGVWPAPISPRTHAEVERVREGFIDEVDEYDTTMVAEYSDEIFAYMGSLEETCMPGERYIDGQGEINWEMRQTLVDWLLQVHLRYHLLPETLWIAVNIVDRFLTKRVVSLVKLQLVGVTAMFIAAKYEEILAPSVDEFVFMTEGGYHKDEILKGERIILQTLDFRISTYCSPYSWVRKISKADDYDIQTRTLSKFLMEVTLLDYRFLRVKPSMIAAVGMYSARRMLGGDWNDAFIYHSGHTEKQLRPGHNLLVEKLIEPNFDTQYIYRKYANKKFLKASIFARDWALRATEEEASHIKPLRK